MDSTQPTSFLCTYHFVGQNDQVIVFRDLTDGQELLFAKDFADRVVGRVEDDHLGLVGDLGAQLVEVNLPLGGGDGLAGGAFGRAQRAKDDLAAVHGNVGDVLVKEGFNHNDLVALVKVAGKGRVHGLVRAGRNEDVGLGVEGSAKLGRVRCCERVSQARATLGVARQRGRVRFCVFCIVG